MDFDLSEEQQQWQEAATEFAQKALAPPAGERDLESTFDRKQWQACAEFGVLGMPIPEEYGGLNLGLGATMAVMEGLGYASADQGLLFSINAHLWTNSIPILRYGTPEQKEKYLPGLCDGTLIGANGASEPEAGSDVFAMLTRAEKTADGYVLNGTKMFVTNAPVCDLIVAYATIDPALGPMGVTGFIVERSMPGVSVSAKMEKMGLRSSPMAELIFENVEVPASQRLGREGRGIAVFECSMEWERGCILANCVGAMQRQLETCLQYARTRKQFGKAIGKYQSVANRLVNMKIRIDTCRPLVYRIASLKDNDRDALMEASIAKVHIAECYVQNSLEAIQTFGGYGYMTEQRVERDLRDAVGSYLYSGTLDIQRNIIARRLGL
jgi:alkylation response protein AidB-like acyl-CoA dehydrogenase